MAVGVKRLPRVLPTIKRFCICIFAEERRLLQDYRLIYPKMARSRQAEEKLAMELFKIETARGSEPP
jgi:hypothetical protein